MMGKIESVILGMVFGAGPIVFCFLATMVITATFWGKEALGPWVLWSLVPGVIIDILFLKKWVRNAYGMNSKILAAIYLFYSTVALGMGMGMPVLNLVLGIMAGIYAARRMHFAGADEEKCRQEFKKMAALSAIIMVLMCCLITLLAIAGKVPDSKFEMAFLSFTFTVPIFIAIVVTGGTALVLLQYYLTLAAAKITIKLSRVSSCR